MGHSRRRDYDRTLTCPECGCCEFFEAQANGVRHHGCVDCFAGDGEIVEPVWILNSISVPPSRNTRLFGREIPAALRKTRSR